MPFPLYFYKQRHLVLVSDWLETVFFSTKREPTHDLTEVHLSYFELTRHISHFFNVLTVLKIFVDYVTYVKLEDSLCKYGTKSIQSS